MTTNEKFKQDLATAHEAFADGFNSDNKNPADHSVEGFYRILWEIGRKSMHEDIIEACWADEDTPEVVVVENYTRLSDGDALAEAPLMNECAEREYGVGVGCTRPKGHVGEHIATNGIEVLARWPKTANPPKGDNQ